MNVREVVGLMAFADGTHPIRPLTPREGKFVRLLLEGDSRIAAYRSAYAANGKPHNVSSNACVLAKKPKIRAVLEMAEMQNWRGLILCGLGEDFCLWKKFESVAAGHTGYVSVQAGRLARQYKRDYQLRIKQERKTEQKLRELFEELTRPKATLAPKLRFDDELTLD
jgi:hypothetical protein